MKLLTPILLIIISIALFFTVVEPLRKSVSQVREDIKAYDIALDNSKYLQTTQDSLIAAYKNIKTDDKTRLEKLLPNTVNNIKFILEIEKIANQYRMPIKDIRFDSSNIVDSGASKNATGSVAVASAPDASRPYGSFSVSFSTEGTYDSFTLFLKDLEHNLRLVDVKSISFAIPVLGTGDTGANASYNYQLTVQTYWLK